MANQSKNIVFRSSILVGGFLGLNKLLSLGRQMILARLFGVGEQLDIYNAANNLPSLLFALIAGSALAFAFIPTLTQTITIESEAAGWRLFNRVLNLAFLTTAALALLIAILALPLVRSPLGIAPGFTLAQQVQVAVLMRFNLIATLIFSLSGIIMSGLQARQKFLMPALAPLLYNGGQLIGAVFLAPTPFVIGGVAVPALGLGIHGLVWGNIMGAMMHLLIQMPALFRAGFRWLPAFSLNDPALHNLFRLLGPRLLGLTALQMSNLIRDNIASYLTTGSVTALRFARALVTLPAGIFGLALGITLLPILSQLVAQGKEKEAQQTLTQILRFIFILIIPASLILIWLLPPAVRLLFEGRAFSGENSQLVIAAARIYLIGLGGQLLLEVIVRAFYAQHDAWTPTLAAIAALIGILVLGLLFAQWLGMVGLALAQSVVITIQAGVLLFFYWRRRQRMPASQAIL